MILEIIFDLKSKEQHPCQEVAAAQVSIYGWMDNKMRTHNGLLSLKREF